MPAVPKSQNTQEPTLDPFHAREPATLASDAGGFSAWRPKWQVNQHTEAPAKHTKERGSEWTWKNRLRNAKLQLKTMG